MRRILTIAGSDSGGGAGIQADLKVITLLGAYGMSVITALTAQNTVGVQAIHGVPVDFIEAQLDAVLSDIGADAAKTGMLANAQIVEAVAAKIEQYRIEKLVVDPVMVAKSGDPLLAAEARDVLIRRLVPLAYVLTPNLHEASVLVGERVGSEEDMKAAARKIHGMGVRHVLIKGGHLQHKALDLLYDGDSFFPLEAPKVPSSNTHGTGCTLSAAIATLIGQGMEVREAVRRAKELITEAIRSGLSIGRGHGPTNPYAAYAIEIERYRAIEAVKRALKRLEDAPAADLLPEVRSNIGYALPNARSAEDVVAVPGRISQVDGRIVAVGEPAFGASRHVASIILTVMKHHSAYRAAMNIRYSPELLRACERLGLKAGCFDRKEEPEEVSAKEGSSLEWGTGRVLEGMQQIPDVIYDKGGPGKEPMIRVIGRDPDEVVEKVLRIAAAAAEE